MRHTLRQWVQYYLQLLIGSLIGAAGVVYFLVPAQIAPGGVSGVSVLLNEVIGTPVGIVILLLNIPIMYIGYRMLPGGWGMVGDSLLVIVIYSVAIDLLDALDAAHSFSDDRLLNAMFGGIIGGISGGIIYRTGTNFGGTSTLALIIQRRLGTPLSTTTLYTDIIVIMGAGLVFGVEGALYAMVVLFISSVAADYVMEGPSVIRTAFIITSEPDALANALMNTLYRGVTAIPARGMYTGQERSMLYVTISRSQVNDLRGIVAEIDESAFVVIGQGHTAYGAGFRKVKQNGGKPKLSPKALQEKPGSAKAGS